MSEIEMCCGTTADRKLMELELKLEGAIEFLDFIEGNVTEDMSAEALMLLLVRYAGTLE